MASDITLKDGSTTSLATTALNSLANNGLVAANFANSSLHPLCDAELFLASPIGGSIAAGIKLAELYYCPSVDGTNYPDGGDASVTPPANHLAGVFIKGSATGTGTCRSVIQGIPLTARTAAFVIKNVCGQTWDSADNTLKITTYLYQSS